MFYDLDILNRRGGRFGIIWLAAHEKIRFNGKGSRNDLRLLLSVDVARICRDIIRYVKVEHPASVPGETSPRFSLYLSAMLTHGAILVHNRQVRHDLAHSRLALQNKPVAEKRSRETNVDCSNLDLSNAQIEENENLLSDGATLAEREFGRLADVVEALRISSGINVLRDGHAANTEVQLGMATPDRIGNDFMDLEAAFNSAIRDPNGHFASESDITLNEIDHQVRINQIQEMDMFEGDLNNTANTFGVGNFPDLSDQLPSNIGIMEVDEDPFADNALKRPHDGAQDEDVPSKQKRNSTDEEAPNSPAAAAAADATEGALPLNIELEPILEIEQPVRRKRNRRPRRFIDTEISIPVEVFRAQRENYADTLRVDTAIADIIFSPRYLGCTANDLLCRSSVPLRGSSIDALVTRHMTTSKQDDTDFSSVLEEIQPENIPIKGAEEVVNTHVSPANRTDRNMDSQQNMNSEINMDGMMENLPTYGDIDNATYPVAHTSEETLHTHLPEDSGVDIETLRPGFSRDISYTGSIAAINTSRVDVSGHERSLTSQNPLPDRGYNLETVKEVSIEVSQQTIFRFSSDPTARSRSTFVTLHEDAEMADTEIQPPLPAEQRLSRTAKTPRYEPIPENSTPIALTPQQRERPQAPVKVPKGQDLMAVICSAVKKASGSLTFRQLVPPGGNYSRIEAAKIFEQLLWLKKERKIDLYQDPSSGLPYEDIEIFL